MAGGGGNATASDGNWLSGAARQTFDLAYALSDDVLYVVCMGVFAYSAFATAHAAIRKMKLRMGSYGLATYCVLLGTFCLQMFRHTYTMVRPASGLEDFDDAATAKACLHVLSFGPIRVLAIQFVCNSILLTPLLLLPPAPRQARALVRRCESALGGSHAGSRLATRLRHLSAPMVAVYLLLFACTLLHAASVYLFAASSVEELAQLERDLANADYRLSFLVGSGALGFLGINTTSIIASTPFLDAQRDFLVPVLAVSAYIVLALAKLIVVYERLTNRDFHGDFPGRMLMTSLPFLKRLPSFAGHAVAMASRLGKLGELAERAYLTIQLAPEYVQEVHKIADEVFEASEQNLLKELLALLAERGGDLTPELLDEVHPRVHEAMRMAAHDLVEAFKRAPQAASAPVSTPPGQWPVPSEAVGCVGNARDEDDDIESVGPDAVAAARIAVVEFFEVARTLFGSVSLFQRVQAAGLMPGDPDLELHLVQVADDELVHLFDTLKEEAPTCAGLGPEWSARWISIRVRNFVAAYKPTAFQGMDGLMAELRLLALHSEHLHADVEAAYARVSRAALRLAPADLRAAEGEAERLVDLASRLGFVQTSWWAWGYYLLGLLSFSLVANFSVATAAALAQLSPAWQPLQRRCAALLLVPFVGLFAFVGLFWVVAASGQIFGRRRHRPPSSRAVPWKPRPRMRAPPSRSRYTSLHSVRWRGGDADLAKPDDGDEEAVDVLALIGVIVPLVLALVGLAMLVGQVATAAQTPMFDRCQALIKGNETAT